MSEKERIQLPESISVRKLAAVMKLEPTTVIGKLIANGVMAHINQELDYDTAALLAEEFGYEAEPETASAVIKQAIKLEGKSVTARPPIVTIMGHVDHGKTSLLDYIRQTNVVSGEAGGITQNISAYQIEFSSSGGKRKITFIDTPGHEAFGALRSHGASLTDLVILVVAADDGIKPQTVEAVKYARAAQVPIVVAVNKIDLPGANIDRVKQQLVELELNPEDWGGKTVVVPISAKTGQGVDQLLEMVLLSTDLLELKADPEGAVEGIVIEARQDKQVGPAATVLVYNGTLRPGQTVVVGTTYGRIRAMQDDRGQSIVQAGPSRPAIIQGLKDVPVFGSRVEVVPNEKVARAIVQQSTTRLAGHGEGEDDHHLHLILKADVGGSLAALQESLAKQRYHDAEVEVLSSGIGTVSEDDIKRAKASHAIVLSFRLSSPRRILELAEKEGVELKEFWVIYELLDFTLAKLREIATPIVEKKELGRLKVLEVFSFQEKEKTAIIGGEVIEGEIASACEVSILRNKESLGEAKATGLRLGKVAADRVEKNAQCGVSLAEVEDIAKGDVLVFQEIKVVK